jgi:phosphohistidine phosphatase
MVVSLMELYLVRHGIAEETSAAGRDAERALTAEGRKKLTEVLGLARVAEVSPSLILSSPYRRAMETARIAAEVLGYHGEVISSKALTPDSDPDAAWQELRLHRAQEQVLAAGHEPLFSRLAAYLLGVPELIVDFKKGAVMRIDLEQFGARPRGVLRWMIVPKLARSSD